MNNLKKKILHFIKYFWNSKKCWSWPKQSQILIFDSCNHQILMEYIRPWHPEILHVRGEKINLPVLFSSLFMRGKKADNYKDCFIKKVQPQLIITFIDNNLSFYEISLRHSNIKTLFIQNGWRGYYADIFETLSKLNDNQLSKLKVDYMLTFGPLIGNEYARYVQGTTIPAGSIKNNQVSHTRVVNPGIIAFISQWYKDGFYMNDIFYSQEDFFRNADFPIIQTLDYYAKTNQKKLMIIPRNLKQGELRDQEEAYFRELIGHDFEFLEPNGIYQTYEALDSAEVIVTVDSTLGYESIARGNKTAIFSVRSNLLGVVGLTYGWPGVYPEEGLFWTNNPKKDSFMKILDYLFKVDNIQWKKDVEDAKFFELMTYNAGNTILKSILEKELK
jgi:surface carbohydrate biosynthesis protein